jgi:tRNA(Ile)-lysidine synthase
MTEAVFPIEAPTAERFAADLDRLAARGSKIGIAVSGGPDSIALLLLASAARPGAIEAATVDHGFRSEAADEATMVSGLCERLGVPHSTLKVEWSEKPKTAIQERARSERYRLLDRWANERGLDELATAHHLDDQAETFLMRLNRGAGVRGLAGMRSVSAVPVEGSNRPLIRPLLSWRRTELEEVCRTAGIEPVSDPSNSDDRYERVRVRQSLAEADWLDADAVARRAEDLARADSELHWTAES